MERYCQIAWTSHRFIRAYNFVMAHNDEESEREAPESASAARASAIEDWFARIDAIKGDPLFPEGRKQNLAPIREYSWDERPSEES
jgi:hypothetical protein